MANTRSSSGGARTVVPQAPNATSGRQPASTAGGRGGAHRRGRGRGRGTTTRTRSTTTRTTREPTPEMSASPPPPSHEGVTAEALISMQRVIEGLADRMDRQERIQQQNTTPAQTQTFGNNEVSLQDFLKLKSPKFTGSENSTDPQGFLDGSLKALRALGCSSERAVELAAYKLEDMAYTWYETLLLGRPAGAAPLTWDEFTKLFMDNFLPDSLRQKYANEFERLVQTPDMDVSTYNTKFCKLARYAPYLVPDEAARVRRFVDRLVGRLYNAVVPQIKTLTYSEAVDLARKIENKGREERAANDLRKKARTGGSFSGGFSENRRAGNQGQQQQGSQTDSVSQSAYRPHHRQGTKGPSSSSSGYRSSGQMYATTPSCQTCGRPHLGQCRVLTGGCYRCGQLGHHMRDCPQPPRNSGQASVQLAAPTQATRNNSGTAGTGNKGRGVGDRATGNHGQGNAGRGQARVFALTRQDVQASNAVVTGILSVCSFDALALIDPGSTHSYVSPYFSLRFDRHPDMLNDPFLVSTPVGASLLVEYVYRACQIRVEGRDTLADLIVLDMVEFDVLMGMDWLSPCYATVDCNAKIVKFKIPNEPPLY
ncbi:uncharacterized protein LOC132047538 [Lycium ferocissimum]|uniref:uncharacterized protein LOC132047538 n=1 Tax=Lycium ferocissimum TaxID=112874 RepID=UPI0028159513|nr:uncharacterized protein LOC132047538 [Lycium ferocissimum]